MPSVIEPLQLPHKTVLAVDPGMSGAAAVLSGAWGCSIQRDFKNHADIAHAIRYQARNNHLDAIVIEKVGAMPGQGVVSMFSFGKSTGVALGAMCCVEPPVEIHEVAPQRWQNFFRKLLNRSREEYPDFDSRGLALALFPYAEHYLKRKKDHNSADALLMGAWWLLNQQ